MKKQQSSSKVLLMTEIHSISQRLECDSGLIPGSVSSTKTQKKTKRVCYELDR